MGKVSVAYDSSSLSFNTISGIVHLSYDYTLTKSDNFSFGALHGPSASAAAGTLSPANASGFETGHDPMTTQPCAGYDFRNDLDTLTAEAPQLQIKLNRTGETPPYSSFSLGVGGTVATVSGTVIGYRPSANGGCETFTDPSNDQFGVGSQEIALSAPGPLRLAGSRVVDSSPPRLPGFDEDITERITYDLTYVGSPDSDGDGLSDAEEALSYGTDPNNADTDGDGIGDGKEVANGTDPLDPHSPSPGGSLPPSATMPGASPTPTIALGTGPTPTDVPTEVYLPPVPTTTATVFACSDGIDNDDDGKIDYPADTGCGSPSDPDENDGCPVVGVVSPLILTHVEVPVSVLIKPYNVLYGDLPLTFTSEAPGPYLCRFQSSYGALPVSVELYGLSTPLLLGTSSTSATVEFSKPGASIPACNFQLIEEIRFNSRENDCSLNGDIGSNDPYVKWSSPGFVFQARDDIRIHLLPGVSIPVPSFPRGALTFYLNASKQFPHGVVNYESALFAAETHIHEKLISELPRVDKITVIQDPPAEVRLTGPGGSIGYKAGGPYLQSRTNNAIAIPNLPDGHYRVTLTGAAGSDYKLSMSTVNFAAGTTGTDLRDEKGTLDRDGHQTFRYTVDTTPPILRLHIAKRGKTSVTLRASCSEACRLTSRVPNGHPRVARANLRKPGSRVEHFRLMAHQTHPKTLTVTAVDPDGNTVRKTITVGKSARVRTGGP